MSKVMLLNIIYLILWCASCPVKAFLGDGFEVSEKKGRIPEFFEPIRNVTVAVGKEAILTCSIRSLGGFKVVWMKAEDQTVFSIHRRVVPKSSKYAISYDGSKIWRLHIRQVKETDQGCYVCQVNTSPMKQQIGCIEVLVPPDIDDEKSTSDISVNEGDDATLTCYAIGRPLPRVVWRREDGDKIIIKYNKYHQRGQTHHDELDSKNESPLSGKSLSTIFRSSEESDIGQIRIKRDKQKVDAFPGETLRLHRITRKMMGAYLCIASNDVPPAVSKRVMLSVNFAPNVRIETQLVGAPLGSTVQLDCKIEAFPSAVNYWIRSRENDVILSSQKYEIHEERISSYQIVISLVIREVSRGDFGTYSCVSTNSLGKAEEAVRLYEIRVNTGSPSTGSYAQRLEPSMFGSTSREDLYQYHSDGNLGQDIALSQDAPSFFDGSNLYLNRTLSTSTSSRILSCSLLTLPVLYHLLFSLIV
ncbi:lachesin-like isoform X2 [Artemia franciscana]|uniref:Ig-like domain-containing protein n=1 Tax=Artemia franciscana TaxID=6661 RepID=A0AA88IBF1_ARTSF|nr:hypothetical protein QYM36_005921 [Artemia franciscana]